MLGILFTNFTQTSTKGELLMKNISNLAEVKNKINSLKGQNIRLKINKGRNKIVSLTAIIDQVYPSMFIINPTCVVDLDRKSYSYNDVLCGDIKLLEEKF